jgi:tetratricopeptide (TPR) repeat protein
MMKKIILMVCLIVFSHCVGGPVGAQEAEEPNNAGRGLEEDLYKKIVEASLVQKKVLNYQIQKHGVDSIETLPPLEALAWMYMEIGNYNEAEVLYKKALHLRNEKMPPSQENTKYIGIAHFMLGEISFLRARYLRAEDHYDRAIEFAVDPEARGDVLDRKGKIYKSIGDYEKALNYYLRAVDEYKAAHQSKQVDERIKSVYMSLVEVYKKFGLLLKTKEYQALIDAMNGEEKKEEEKK